MRKCVSSCFAAISLVLMACSPKPAPVTEKADVPVETAKEDEPQPPTVANDAAAQNAAGLNTKDVMDKSAQAAEWFRTKQWDKIREAASTDFRAALTDDQFGRDWDASVAKAGEFERNVYRLPFKQDHFVVQVLAKHSNGAVEHNYVWDDAGHLVKMSVTYKDALKSCPEDCRADVAAAFEGFMTGDYALFAKNATEVLRQELSEEAFGVARAQIQALAGDIEYLNSPSIDVKDAVNRVYTLNAHHAKMNFVYLITFDGEGRMGGFVLNPAFEKPANAQPESTERWTETEVSFRADAQYPISGYLTLPKDAPNPPVVILVHGSGCHDRNETLMENAPFRDIAHGLAERGIATLRYDKRCMLYPDSAVPDKLTVQTEVTDDFDAAVRMIQADARVDAKRIYVLGHSLGGMLVPYFASKHPELAGAVSMAGSLRSLFEILAQQLQLTLAESRKQPGSEATVAILEKNMRELDDKAGRLDALADDEKIVDQPVRYWKSLNAASGAKWLDTTKMPILVLQGSADMQVYSDDYDLWLAAEKQHSNIRCMRFERLNHLMMPTTLENPNIVDVAKDYSVASKVDDKVIDAIASFVQNGK